MAYCIDNYFHSIFKILLLQYLHINLNVIGSKIENQTRQRKYIPLARFQSLQSLEIRMAPQ